MAIAPGAFINETLCRNVVHYLSMRDIAPIVDVIGSLSCLDTMTLLTAESADLIDHSFTSPTFKNHLKAEIKKYLEK